MPDFPARSGIVVACAGSLRRSANSSWSTAQAAKNHHYLNDAREGIEMRKLEMWLGLCFACCSVVFFAAASRADNKVLGQVEFVAGNKVAQDGGVWVDGQYVGYLKELKGSKTVYLLPGDHQIAVREAGYTEFTQKVSLMPGEKVAVNVTLEKSPDAHYSSVTAELKISVNPDRAAVFLDGMYAGHAHEFGGVGRSMLVSPGKHRITITLPGYQAFETEVTVVANQKYQIKTDLVKATTPDTSAAGS
jgi:hypothetical protein